MSVFWVAREKHGSGNCTYGIYVASTDRNDILSIEKKNGEILWTGSPACDYVSLCASDFEAMTGIHLQPGEGPIPFATPEPKRVDFPELEGLDERGNKV